MVRKVHLSFLLLLCLALVGPQLGCGGPNMEAREADGGKNGGEKEEEDSSIPVEVAVLSEGFIEAVLKFSTNLEAERQVSVLSESARRVERLLVEEGDRVRKGQVLLRLQDDEQKTTLDKVDSELRKVEREYERQKRLHEQGFLSEEDFSNATYQIEQLKFRQVEARRDLSYTAVRAPIGGTVTRRDVSLGDFVTHNQPLFEVVDFDSIVARVFVPEKDLVFLHEGQLARLSAPSLGGADHSGKVERLAPVVDPQTGTVKVTVAISDKSGLRPGLYVDVELVTAAHETALLVPKRALVYDEEQIFVYRMKGNDRVERVLLRPLLEDKTFVEPVAGFSPGDRVVVAGQAGLKDGAQVRVVASSAGSESPSEVSDPEASR